MKTIGLSALAIVAFSLAFGSARTAENTAHWSYGGEEGPAHWGDLQAEYAACSTGAMQSPVDLAQLSETGEGEVVDVKDRFAIMTFTGAANAKDVVRKR